MEELSRPSIADGILYYSDRSKLQTFIKTSITANKIPKKGVASVLIVPSASYLLAGNVYGSAYAQLLNEEYESVIIIGQAQKRAFYSLGLSTSTSFETPIGSLAVDQEANEILRSFNPDFIVDKEEYHLEDPTIELQIPYLLEALPAHPPIVPILIGESNTKFTIMLANAIKFLKDMTKKRYLIIVSSNLSTEQPLEKTITADKRCIELIKGGNPDILAEQFALRQIRADGDGGIVTVSRLHLLEGEKKFELLKYHNSSDTTEDLSRVEGYLAAVFYD